MINDRINDIFNLVDKLKPNDYINELIKKYSSELENYLYIDTEIKFSLLKLKGSIKYINKYDKKIRYGGLLIKIYKKNKGWYGIILKSDGSKNYVLFKLNYIFYCENIGDINNKKFRENLEYFIINNN